MNRGDSPAETLAEEISAPKPDITLNLHQGYHTDLQIVTAISTINIQVRHGKLGKVTQTETIRV